MITPYFLENFWVGSAFYIHAVYTGAIPYYSACVPSLPCSCQLGIAYYSLCWGSSPLYRHTPVEAAVPMPPDWLVSSRPSFIFFGDYYFATPGVWGLCAVNPSNLKSKIIHPSTPLIGQRRLAWNVYGQFHESYWTVGLSVIAVGRTRHFFSFRNKVSVRGQMFSKLANRFLKTLIHSDAVLDI